MVTTVSATEGRCRCRCRLRPPSAAGWSWRPPTPRCQRYARHVVGAFGGRAAKADGHHGVGHRGPILQVPLPLPLPLPSSATVGGLVLLATTGD